MMNGENGDGTGISVGGGGLAKPTPPPTLPKSYTPSAAAAYRLASMERLAQRQRIFEQGGPPPPPASQPSGGAAASDDQQQHHQQQQQPTPTPPPVTAPKPVLGTKASTVAVGRQISNSLYYPPPIISFSASPARVVFFSVYIVYHMRKL